MANHLRASQSACTKSTIHLCGIDKDQIFGFTIINYYQPHICNIKKESLFTYLQYLYRIFFGIVEAIGKVNLILWLAWGKMLKCIKPVGQVRLQTNNSFIFYCKCVHYFRGMKRDECVAPIPGRPCLTGLYVMENSPR